MDQHRHALRGRLELDTGVGQFLGDTRIRLLEAIEAHGSISQAAKAVPMSYKAAWDAIDAMNNLAEAPLVVRATGGRNGGGTRLTDHGRRTVALYRALDDEYQAALARLTERLGEAEAQDVDQFRLLLRRLSMKTSARNQFAGTVVGLVEGEVDFEVQIRLDAHTEVVAVITGESAEALGLHIGGDITALVKSSSVLLLTDRRLRTSARNHLWGEVTRIHAGPVNAEVTLALPGGRSVCAVITHDSVAKLGLQVGQPACAVFKASAVILCQNH
ncbi:LysR family transcriptional regulator [Nitrogeniibacter mangrovi]|uniref:LysR family transcriptional regulator n=1 Tax=Nitrogeniibacter mangrovi TaxID=2016596 RepID=A0A6C1B6V6_9RHOO|nr:TOBE domain-containing protein [Nitrogeniibacter mangrovi]QID19496.1 LysR family transcriptional regulator [Nitrogeniibacter mangrovi]